jgi:drug/metabolite transporter (DMT)-like permease
MNTMGKYRNLILMHVIVFIWGFTGILGKEIHLESVPLVWWRCLVAALTLGLFIGISRKKQVIPFREILKMMGVGLLTALHWICFFGSIKASNLSIALAVLSTSSFFVAIVSPLIRKEKFQPYELFLGVALFIGVGIMLKFESDKTMGILLSLGAAFFAALFSTFNSKLVEKHPPTQIAFYEMVAAFLGISVVMLFYGNADVLYSISSMDLLYIIILGALATGVAYVIGIEVMKELSPFTCAVAVNMEPIYTIAFALLIYGQSEIMSSEFYVGLLIIVVSVFLDAWLKYRKKSTSLADKPGVTGTLS